MEFIVVVGNIRTLINDEFGMPAVRLRPGFFSVCLTRVCVMLCVYS